MSAHKNPAGTGMADLAFPKKVTHLNNYPSFAPRPQNLGEPAQVQKRQRPTSATATREGQRRRFIAVDGRNSCLTMGNHNLLAFAGESPFHRIPPLCFHEKPWLPGIYKGINSNQGFLGGAKFILSIHSSYWKWLEMCFSQLPLRDPQMNRLTCWGHD